VGQPRSVFVDEGILDLNYVPPTLIHREGELRFLTNLFRFIFAAPYEMSQRVIIVGKVGTGKTALAQRFGLNLIAESRRRRVQARYIHVNCREFRGSLFMILRRALKVLKPGFPDRGYSSNELLGILIQVLDEINEHLVLCLDEVDALIDVEGSDALYNLTRVQEARMEEPRRLSLICISKNLNSFNKLDRSTISTLQRNAIKLDEYTKPQLADIVISRVKLAFRGDAISPGVVDFISQLSSTEGGDARYAIDLLWRAGKYAEDNFSKEVLPEHVRRAAATLFPVLREEAFKQLSRHEKLTLLAIARYFRHSHEVYASTGKVEQSYHIVCEEYGEKPRGHTQFWKYLNRLKAIDAVSIRLQANFRGRTQLISLSKVPSEELEKVVTRILEQG
jgi:cell division control protein 6